MEDAVNVEQNQSTKKAQQRRNANIVIQRLQNKQLEIIICSGRIMFDSRSPQV